ncbi:MAG TPA: hypothetical protein VFW98_08380 [Gemmatimonadaceae bacterium]|nr:hypothetical protein [Gemmatimonadaceae bacterium]
MERELAALFEVIVKPRPLPGREDWRDGWTEEVRIGGVEFRVTMVRHETTPRAPWRRPRVWWGATIHSLPDEGLRFQGRVNANSTLVHLFRVAGLLLQGQCGHWTTCWHYDRALGACDACAAEVAEARAEAAEAVPA